jgi:hypothetical protein
MEATAGHLGMLFCDDDDDDDDDEGEEERSRRPFGARTKGNDRWQEDDEGRLPVPRPAKRSRAALQAELMVVVSWYVFLYQTVCLVMIFTIGNGSIRFILLLGGWGAWWWSVSHRRGIELIDC